MKPQPPRQDTWEEVCIDNIGFIPGMIAKSECRYLKHIASMCSGVGEVIELGPWMGRSTCHIAAGLPPNTHLHVYDHWVLHEIHMHRTGVEHLSPGDDMQPDWRRWTDPFTEHLFVHEHKGAMRGATWPADRPIELLVLDGPKTIDDIDHTLRQWGQALIPGQSFLANQDFLYSMSYQLPLMLGAQEGLELVHVVSDQGGMVGFNVTGPLHPVPNIFEWPREQAEEVYWSTLEKLQVEERRMHAGIGWPFYLYDRSQHNGDPKLRLEAIELFANYPWQKSLEGQWKRLRNRRSTRAKYGEMLEARWPGLTKS